MPGRVTTRPMGGLKVGDEVYVVASRFGEFYRATVQGFINDKGHKVIVKSGYFGEARQEYFSKVFTPQAYREAVARWERQTTVHSLTT